MRFSLLSTWLSLFRMSRDEMICDKRPVHVRMDESFNLTTRRLLNKGIQQKQIIENRAKVEMLRKGYEGTGVLLRTKL